MISAKDLRVGCWFDTQHFEDDKRFFQVEEIRRHSNESLNQKLGISFRNGSGWIDCEYAEPIPLTEEILLKCGFEKRNDTESSCVYVLGNFELFDTKRDLKFYIWFQGSPLPQTHLHQLQNLIHSLTGEELIINL